MPKVLIIEDDQNLRDIYREEFETEGFSVTVAVDGEEGLQKISELRPDIILLDILMPKMTGFDVLTKIKKDEQLKSIPVLVLTNLYTDTYDLVKNWGAAFVLMKVDHTPGQVVTKVREILESQPKS